MTGNIPPELGGLYSLQWFELYNNKLTGYIPEELGSLSNLEQLYLSVNGFVGCIPDGLRSIQLSDHSVFGLPYCSDPPIPTPTPLNISCPHPGPIEESAIDRAALEALYWATIAGSWKNRLKWMTAAPIAEWHGVTTDYCSGRVTELNLSSNGLSGKIPPEVGGLSSLEVLLLDSNYLRSEIPPELGQLASLRVLNISNSSLVGTIPSELGALHNLWLLYVSGNKLEGCIPEALRNVPNNDLDNLDLPFC